MAEPVSPWINTLLPRTAMFPARLDGLVGMRRFLEHFCTEISLARDTCLRLNLVLEELFTNIVQHGHQGDSDAPVWVTLADGNEAVDVTLEDTAPPFNPFAQAGLPAKKRGRRKIGGLGVLLARELTISRDYSYIFGRNRIRLQLLHAR
jgi:serine/threonine-protein kinase RsbW